MLYDACLATTCTMYAHNTHFMPVHSFLYLKNADYINLVIFN